jgi:hypothetical protein
LFFKTKSDAAAELDRIKIKFRDAGEKALEITDELRLAALKCARRPSGAPWSLPEGRASGYGDA